MLNLSSVNFSLLANGLLFHWLGLEMIFLNYFLNDFFSQLFNSKKNYSTLQNTSIYYLKLLFFILVGILWKRLIVREYFLDRIFLYSDWIPYSVRIQENTDQKILRIWKPSTQCAFERVKRTNDQREIYQTSLQISLLILSEFKCIS